MPLVLLGGIVSRDERRAAMAEGFDFVAMGRALIADPDLVSACGSDPHARSRCTHCNMCVAEMDRSGVRCVLDDSLRRARAPNRRPPAAPPSPHPPLQQSPATPRPPPPPHHP